MRNRHVAGNVSFHQEFHENIRRLGNLAEGLLPGQIEYSIISVSL